MNVGQKWGTNAVLKQTPFGPTVESSFQIQQDIDDVEARAWL
jgi:hypothetical protein